MNGAIPIGSLVRVSGIPDLTTLPPETRLAFELALGKMFRVVGRGPYGHLELELGPELDRALGGFMNTIWIEPAFVSDVAYTTSVSKE